MASFLRTVTASASALLLSAHLTAGEGACDFDLEPLFPGYFWDSNCTEGGLGCDADGKSNECRFCGAGNYSEIDCPPSSCHFPNEPFVNYYWDKECKLGMLGCWADGIHEQCRFCGDAPYSGIACPDVVGGKGHGASMCSFHNQPWVPTYWDENCTNGMLGCLADGVNEKCRFCAIRPFEDIPCPEGVKLPALECTWPENTAPSTPFFWDEECEMGKLGCWADGIHAECRFCGVGPFADVACPIEEAEVEEKVDETAEVASPQQHAAAQAVHQDSAQFAPAATESVDEVEVSGAAAKVTIAIAALTALTATAAVVLA